MPWPSKYSIYSVCPNFAFFGGGDKDGRVGGGVHQPAPCSFASTFRDLEYISIFGLLTAFLLWHNSGQ